MSSSEMQETPANELIIHIALRLRQKGGNLMRLRFKKALALLASAAMCGSMALSYPNGAFSLDAFASTESTETALDGNWTDYANYRSFTSNKKATYEIGTAEDFAAFAKAVNETTTDYGLWYGTVKLTNDIDLSGHYWIPIGENENYFMGTFDGQGYTISNMTIDTEGLYYAGLFGRNNGIIKNVNIDSSCSVTGTKVSGYIFYMGAICGENNNGTIENCSNAGDVISTDDVGGICGHNNGTITNCYNTGDITGTDDVGGICGDNIGTITSCYNKGDITGEYDVCGICGINNNSINGFGRIANCYNTGEVICNSLYTDEISRNGASVNSYYLADSDDGNGGKTAEQFASGEVAYLLSQGCNLTYTDYYYNEITGFFSGESWGQNLKTDDSDTEYDAYPVISDDVVYAGYETSYCGNTEADRLYSNTEFAVASIPEHESWESGICTACSTVCTHESYTNGECDVCDVVCTHENYTNGECDVCDVVCTHENYTNGECDVCDVVCTHESYTGGICDVCDVVCSHESYTDYICEECDLLCGHNYYDEDEGYIINDYYAADHVIACHICGFEKAEEHTYEDGYCTVCEYDELGTGSDFIYKDDLEFNDDESKGSLEDDGYEWNHETKTLTLGNIYVNGNIILPYYAADGNTSQANTLIISGSSTAVITGNICGSPYDQSLTIMSSDLSNTGRIKTGISNSNVGLKDTLTIKDVTLITDSLMWMTNGGLSVEGAELKVSDYCFIEAITIDESSTLELSTTIGGYGNVENGLSDIAHHLPEGYTLVTEGETTYVIDSNGEQVDETVIFDGSVVTPCADDNNDGICDSCGRYIDGIGAKLAGYSLILEGNIGVNFYMELDESVISDEDAYMQFTLGGEELSQVKVSEADVDTETVEGKTYYVFRCGVPAKDMDTAITAQIILSDGTEGAVYEYTVKEYADYILDEANNFDEATRNLASSMLSYGDYAEAYFNGTELAATEEMDAITADTFAEYACSVTDENSIYYGSSLLLKSDTIIRHYFTEEVAGSTQKGDLWYIDTESISADKLGTAITTELDGISISYSPLSYAYKALSSETTSDSLKNLAKAMYIYYQAADAYVNGVEVYDITFSIYDSSDSAVITANGIEIADGSTIQVEEGGSVTISYSLDEKYTNYIFVDGEEVYYEFTKTFEYTHSPITGDHSIYIEIDSDFLPV
ncbi:MAG: hypothetical protein E7497_05915 [Ruminococcus sp.]|nr:hypothetical protein [Ruminococcus sp.]